MRFSRGARRCLKRLQKFCCGKNHCWPRRETIARDMGVSVRQVARYLAELSAENVLSSSRRRRSSAVYTLQPQMSSQMSSQDVLSSYIVLSEGNSKEKLKRLPPQMETQTRPIGYRYMTDEEYQADLAERQRLQA